LEENLTLEAALNQLETVVKQMEDPKVSLEDSFQLYKQGMDLAAYCNEKIETVEKELIILGDEDEHA
jgi:exodeoxyribonuclease VII small subunit